MACIYDHGAVPVDLGPLIAAVQAVPINGWIFRSDRESDRTCAAREDSAGFPRALVASVIDAAVAAYLPAGYQNRLVLSCVPAGAEILPHRDDFGDVVRRASFHCHIPLITSPEAVLGFPAISRVDHLEIGRLYSIDETEEHYVKNPSATDRVHLLFAHFPHDGRGRPFFKFGD